MSLTGSLSDLQISIPFFVPSVSEQGPGLGSGRSQGVCGAGACRESIPGVLEPELLRSLGNHRLHRSHRGHPERCHLLSRVSPHPSLSIKAQPREVSWERQW